MRLKPAEFFYENYPTAKDVISYETCVEMIKKYNVFYIPDTFIALYLNVNDDYFNLINKFPEYLKDENFIKRCFVNKGNNVHIFFCVGSGIKNILECVRTVSENAKTVSWYRDDFKQLHIRRLLCPSHC